MHREQKIRKAEKLYEDFHLDGPDSWNEYSDVGFEVGAEVGVCDGILYTTVRNGKTESYIHEFSEVGSPTLIASFDGKKLALVGGDFKFTERGIVDADYRD